MLYMCHLSKLDATLAFGTSSLNLKWTVTIKQKPTCEIRTPYRN